MRIWCLSSWTLQHPQEYHFDLEREKLCGKYGLTELFIGKKCDDFEFQVFREDVGLLRYKMKPGYVEINKLSNEIIDIKVLESNSYWQSRISSIRIRCVRNSSKHKLTAGEKTYYRNYAAKIEEYARGDPERREAAFSVIEKFKLEDVHQAEYKNKRVDDLVDAFDGLCTAGRKRVNARFDQNIDRTIDIHYHAENDERINRIRDFKKSRQIKIYRGKIPDVNPKWFEAIHLEKLELSHCQPFKSPGSWNSFVEGISKCPNIYSLKLDYCGIFEIPESLFYSLPSSLCFLSFDGNNVTKLPQSISNLVCLREISLSNNPNLTDDGFPWNSLPRNLVSLNLDETSITVIPEDIDTFPHLLYITCGNKLTNISWEHVHEDIRILKLGCAGTINSPESAAYYLTSVYDFNLINAGLEGDYLDRLPAYVSRVNLSKNNIKMLECFKYYRGMKALCLNHNQITFISWSFIGQSLPLLTKLELAYNQCSEPFWFGCLDTRLSILDLRHNLIKHVKAEFLPPTLRLLNLSSNQISSFSSIEHLVNLCQLTLDNNLLTSLPEGIERCSKLNYLSFSHNHISSFPVGFEAKKGMTLLDLSYNHFSAENEETDLNSCLWDRLPVEIEVLYVSGNNLLALPCQLGRRIFWRLEAEDCNLKSICPRIGSVLIFKRNNLLLNVKKNDDLNFLSFVPSKVYELPRQRKSKTFKNIKHFEESRLILTASKTFKNTEQFRSYDFSPKPFVANKRTCSCCARCGLDCSNEAEIDTLMVMDFTLVVQADENPIESDDVGTEKEKELINYFIPRNPNSKTSKILNPGEWKTRVRTRLCQICIPQLMRDIQECEDNVPAEYKLKRLFTAPRTIVPKPTDKIVNAMVESIMQSASRSQLVPCLPQQPPIVLPSTVNRLNVDATSATSSSCHAQTHIATHVSCQDSTVYFPYDSHANDLDHTEGFGFPSLPPSSTSSNQQPSESFCFQLTQPPTYFPEGFYTSYMEPNDQFNSEYFSNSQLLPQTSLNEFYNPSFCNPVDTPQIPGSSSFSEQSNHPQLIETFYPVSSDAPNDDLYQLAPENCFIFHEFQ